MNVAFRKTTMGAAAVATAGVSALFVGAAPANAAVSCGVGTLIAPGVCELKFTSDGQFIPTAEMTKLEVLLVGAGGSGVPVPMGTAGYAAAGGGGEVKVVDFSTATDPITVTVPQPGAVLGGASDGGSNVATVNNGSNGTFSTSLEGAGAFGGDSGNGNAGSTDPFGPPFAPHASGAGDGGVPANIADGGPGSAVSAIAPVGSLFATDLTCYGGGGAVGVPGTPGSEDPPVPAILAIVGIATCGGGAPNGTATDLTAALANSGGGGGSIGGVPITGSSTGAAGIVVFRWVPTLPATGGAPVGLLPAALVALIAGAGLAAVAGSRRKRMAD